MESMRRFARERVQKYPSIAKVYEAVTGLRRMGSEETVVSYAKAVRKFCRFNGLEDPEALLQKFQSGQANPGKKVDEYIDYALTEEKYAHGHARGLARADFWRRRYLWNRPLPDFRAISYGSF